MAKTPEKTGSESLLKNLAVDVAVALLLALLCSHFIRPTIVRQTSMENTLHSKDYLLMYKQAYRTHSPERGDIIIFRSSLTDEKGRSKLLVKRVIGLPGDSLMIKDQQLYINGEEYYEDYLKDGFTPAGDLFDEGETFTVPDGYIFAMGDNRVSSIDSRFASVGCVSEDDIVGKVIIRLYPFNKISLFG